MNILLINPPFDARRGQGGCMLPLNLCYIASCVRASHPRIALAILDCGALRLDHGQAVAQVCRIAPDLIGITANSCAFDEVVALVAGIKRQMRTVPVVIGGPHPSALPREALLQSGADYAVVGEGEITMSALADYISNKDGDISSIAGLAFRRGDKVIVNNRRALIEDLDKLPLPARDLLDHSRYFPPATKRVGSGRHTLLATSRGCPFACAFCAAHSVWTSTIRRRSAAGVVGEMSECVARYDIRSFHFTDELFAADRARTLEICRMIVAQRLEVAWVCSARAHGMDEELLCAMRQAGCREISFGIESGDATMLRRIGKGLSLQEAERTIALTKKMGIATHASYLFGYPGDDERSMAETLRFAKRLNTDIAAFFIASPLPGSRLYREARRHGWLRADATWGDYAPLANARSVLELPQLPVATIRRWHRKAIRSYYLRPRYLLARIMKIRRPFQLAVLLGGLRLLYRFRR